ncbi:carboxylating nicotinate-nucleotide diphosphorylase [bacterium]|nr:carboxylating nicotinate-nucleotide diphosphorylase [bacterium]
MLNKFYIEDHIKKALAEDIGFGDITTDFLTNETDMMKCNLSTRVDGIFCGKSVFETVFELLSKEVKIDFYFNDGDKIKKGDIIARIEGPAKYILMGERTALNYVQRMSGIATETNKYQNEIGEYDTKIVDTRKTTPLFRSFEKYSVKIGGGSLHRFNLSDCAMIKDNHIKYAGSLTKAVEQLRKHISHAHKIEVECDTIEQVKEALSCKANIIMLDNMSINEMKEAVKLINKNAIVEASGNVNLSTVKEIASTGVDIISSSAIVAKAPTLDLGLDCD